MSVTRNAVPPAHHSTMESSPDQNSRTDNAYNFCGNVAASDKCHMSFGTASFTPVRTSEKNMIPWQGVVRFVRSTSSFWGSSSVDRVSHFPTPFFCWCSHSLFRLSQPYSCPCPSSFLLLRWVRVGVVRRSSSVLRSSARRTLLTVPTDRRAPKLKK